jgi:hypothetical protein
MRFLWFKAFRAAAWLGSAVASPFQGGPLCALNTEHCVRFGGFSCPSTAHDRQPLNTSAARCTSFYVAPEFALRLFGSTRNHLLTCRLQIDAVGENRTGYGFRARKHTTAQTQTTAPVCFHKRLASGGA